MFERLICLGLTCAAPSDWSVITRKIILQICVAHLVLETMMQISMGLLPAKTCICHSGGLNWQKLSLNKYSPYS